MLGAQDAHKIEGHLLKCSQNPHTEAGLTWGRRRPEAAGATVIGTSESPGLTSGDGFHQSEFRNLDPKINSSKGTVRRTMGKAFEAKVTQSCLSWAGRHMVNVRTGS